MKKKIALVLGATGGIGSEIARALLAHGWTVRALHRNPSEGRKRAGLPEGLEWIPGDAMDAASVKTAAIGADVIVHAVNPPGYKNWKGLALPMLESTIAAAMGAGARIVFPGTVYNFAPELTHVDECAPQHPVTRKGAIRVAMEQRLAAAARDGVPVLIVRAGDFFGAHAGNSWFSQGIVRPGHPLTAVTYPGAREVGHDWAYLPDLAETFARLLDRAADLERFAVFHFEGHWFEHGVELATATRRVAGKPDAPIRRFPWLLVYLTAPFVETFRELIEMRYLWNSPLRLDNRKLVAFLGEEPHTALDEALGETLRGLGV
jgi:nucleoside-diphosphate-sugar epimerase